MSEDQLRRELHLQGKHLEDKIAAEIRRLSEHILAQRDQINAALAAADRAVDKAERSTKEQIAAHNDLIRKGEVKEATYASKSEVSALEKQLSSRFSRLESFQSKIIGGLTVIGVIGIANFVKLFFG